MALALFTASFIASSCIEANAQALGPQERTLVEAYNASGTALFKDFAAKPGNIVFSPYSIGTAMAMALQGARGENGRQMAGVFKQTLPREEIAEANATVRAALQSYDKSGAKCPGGLKPSDANCQGVPSASLLIANALMLGPRGELVSGEYAGLLKDKYGADIFKNAGVDEINNWVNRATQGKIDRIVDRVDPNNVATLLDAVYFNAKWAARFHKGATIAERFNLNVRAHMDVPTMHLQADFAITPRLGNRVAQPASYRAIRLPYEVGSLGMIILLPDAVDGAALIAQHIDAREWAEIAATLRDPANEKFIDHVLPRFKTKFTADLASPFTQQGMVRAFDPKLADFSGISGKPPTQVPLFISAIAHRAMIDVMEDGTEATAATSVAVAVASVRRPSETFRIDHPFLFALMDDASGAILFQGRITDPK